MNVWEGSWASLEGMICSEREINVAGCKNFNIYVSSLQKYECTLLPLFEISDESTKLFYHWAPRIVVLCKLKENTTVPLAICSYLHYSSHFKINCVHNLLSWSFRVCRSHPTFLFCFVFIFICSSNIYIA